MKHISAFLGGAIVGAAAALLFAPEKGQELREKIRQILVRNGVIQQDTDAEEIIDQIVEEVNAPAKKKK